MDDVSLRSLTPMKRLDYALFRGFRGKSRDCLKDHAGPSDRLLSDCCGGDFRKDTRDFGRTAGSFPLDNRDTPKAASPQDDRRDTPEKGQCTGSRTTPDSRQRGVGSQNSGQTSVRPAASRSEGSRGKEKEWGRLTKAYTRGK